MQAPEVIQMKEPDPYTPYCDVYSFGVVIYELITAQLPYRHVEGRDTVGFSFSLPAECSALLCMSDSAQSAELPQ